MSEFTNLMNSAMLKTAISLSSVCARSHARAPGFYPFPSTTTIAGQGNICLIFVTRYGNFSSFEPAICCHLDSIDNPSGNPATFRMKKSVFRGCPYIDSQSLKPCEKLYPFSFSTQAIVLSAVFPVRLARPPCVLDRVTIHLPPQTKASGRQPPAVKIPDKIC